MTVLLLIGGLGLVVFAWAEPQASPNLKARADSAQGNDKISASLEYAHQSLEYANQLYTDGDIEKAEAAAQESMTYAQLAVETAIASNKRLKQTEINLRKLEHRMKDIGASLSVDDRPPIEKNVQELEQFRADLLAKMFGEKAEPKGKSQ